MLYLRIIRICCIRSTLDETLIYDACANANVDANATIDKGKISGVFSLRYLNASAGFFAALRDFPRNHPSTPDEKLSSKRRTGLRMRTCLSSWRRGSPKQRKRQMVNHPKMLKSASDSSRLVHLCPHPYLDYCCHGPQMAAMMV